MLYKLFVLILLYLNMLATLHSSKHVDFYRILIHIEFIVVFWGIYFYIDLMGAFI